MSGLPLATLPSKPIAVDPPGAAVRESYELPRVSVTRWHQVAEQARSERTPLVIDRAFGESVAVRTWTPSTLAERFGESSVGVAVDLPPGRAPYLDDSDPHTVTMPLAEVVGRLQAGERCYMNQADLSRFGGLVREIDPSTIATPPIFSVNMWLGGATRSGLHFDSADNFLVQVYGEKRAVLVAPRYARHLNLVSDIPSKSALSADEIEAPASSAFVGVPRWRATISGGDALFIPRGWWHYLASSGLSISVNVWHGDHLSVKEHWGIFLRSGPTVWARVVRDFVWCGLLRHPYRQRLFSPPPLGVDLHRRFRNWRRR